MDAFRAAVIADSSFTSKSYSVELILEVALAQLQALWFKNAPSVSGELPSNLYTYIEEWFTWPERSGLGRFCPITKLLFAGVDHSQVSLQLFRELRLDWQERLVLHLSHHAHPKSRRLTTVAEEILGIYFARQFAMQADESVAYPIAPWLEMVRTSVQSG